VRLTRKQASELGVPVPGKSARPDTTLRDKLFLEQCKAHGLPAPVAEYRFALEIGRQWRFDWLFDFVALEVEGGAFTQGRHTRGQGFVEDIDKYNEAQIMGYLVLRCTPEDIETGAVFGLLKRALGSSEGA
jgi:hypothetical protein